MDASSFDFAFVVDYGVEAGKSYTKLVTELKGESEAKTKIKLSLFPVFLPDLRGKRG